MAIRLLSAQVIDQIAAGEVVERPASAAKELVENSLDAGATRITVSLEEGGTELLRVQDDGRGIEDAELELAVTAHATSKISSIDDLEAVATMGFRGEALAAIGSVSRLTVTSRTERQETAAKMVVESGARIGPMPSAGNRGTTVEVRNLFGAVPARRKFLKSAGAETARVVEVVLAAALARPEVAFEVSSNGRSLLSLAATTDRRQRLLSALGPELGDSLLEVGAEAPTEGGEVVRVTGFVGKPDTARGTSKWMRIYMNGRPIIDRSVQHALREGFRGLMEPSQFPVAVLFIECPPALVDVNVHPSKTEVRFRQPSLIHSLVHSSVRRTLEGTDVIPALQARSWSLSGASPPVFAPRPASAPWGELAADASLAVATRDRAAAPPQEQPLRVLQLDRTWLVFEEDGALVVVDQHALHERVMFEELLSRVSSGCLESQRFLVPLVFAVSASAIERVESMRPLLSRLGFDVEVAGPRSIALHAAPTLLASRRVDAQEFIQQLVERDSTPEGLLREGDDLRAEAEGPLADVLDMMACKAAVKAGDTLSPEEISDLLAQRARIERSSRCPHGRPTSMRIPLVELERRFGRR